MSHPLEDIAKRLGADIIGEISDDGGGAFGAARLAHIYQQRMEERRRQQPPDSARPLAKQEGGKAEQ